MEVPEEIEKEVNDKWQKEKDRLEESKKRVMSFGYMFLIEAINDIRDTMAIKDTFNSGVLLGQLLQIIIENKKYFKQE